MHKPVLSTIIIILIVVFLALVIYFAKDGFVGRRSYISALDYGVPIFNFGTREWSPTHLMSYDVRGDIPISYYPVGAFNQPENPRYPINNTYYPILEPNFYTYEYVNPLQGIVPPEYNSNYSVPYKVDNKNSTGGYKAVVDKA